MLFIKHVLHIKQIIFILKHNIKVEKLRIIK